MDFPTLLLTHNIAYVGIPYGWLAVLVIIIAVWMIRLFIWVD